MLITKEVEMTWTNNRKIYEPFGYKYTGQYTKFMVKIEHLSKTSHLEVDWICDYCGENRKTGFGTYNRNLDNSDVKKDCCKSCTQSKIKEQSLLRNGCNHPKQKGIKVENIISEFEVCGYFPLFSKYNNSREILEYICEKHADKGVQGISYANFKFKGGTCYYCGYEIVGEKLRKYKVDDVVQEFKERHYTLDVPEYITLQDDLFYTCDIHPEMGKQKVSYEKFKLATDNCRACWREARSAENSVHWKGGLSALSHKLRYHILPWVEDSKQVSNYKCTITDENGDVVHHPYAFHLIVGETLDYFNIDYNVLTDIKLKDIDVELMKKISAKCLELHYSYGLGIFLTNKAHNLFHDLYSREFNTPEQFQEFKLRYEMGEFNESSQSEQIA